MPTFLLLLTLAPIAFAQTPIGDAPALHGTGWISLLDHGLNGWHGLAGNADEWYIASSATWDSSNPMRIEARSGSGGLIVNGPKGRTTNLVTTSKFGDVELYLEFLIPKGSNSGVYLHGLYEVQILDSFGVTTPGVHDCGAIYQRWINNQGVGGSPPLRNASRAPGQWQTFHIWFKAPRFDSKGNKIANGRFLRVLQNQMEIQKEVEVEGPTRAGLDLPEAAKNPLMLQGDHGPVAFRNIYIRPLSR